MKKGSRWYSMEMAGVVCETGGSIIRLARKWMEKLGRPLELDTDGIWLMLPTSFPDRIKINLISGKSMTLSYPCALLNRLVHSMFTNDQYHKLLSPISISPKERQYSITTENSIFFEIDGPYRAMILPASTEEDRLLKKRYAVFSFDGSLAELKGFEIKRRGELRLTKLFQSELFNAYLEGDTLSNCYEYVSRITSKWLDLLDSKASLLSEHELFELVTESRTMSKPLSHYTNSSKSPSITTAKRLAEFLGRGILAGEGTSASLTCAYVIAIGSPDVPVAEKAIPVAIWSAEPEVREFYLSSWIKSIGGTTTSLSLHNILDWNYYKERFESLVLKLVIIPASMQGLSNPFGKRIQVPTWLKSQSVTSTSTKKLQLSLKDSWTIISKNDGILGNELSHLTVDYNFDNSNNEEESLTLPSNDGSYLNNSLLSTSFKKWLHNIRPIWTGINAAKRKRGTRWSTTSTIQGPCAILGISVLKGLRKFRIWIIPLYQDKKGPFTGLQKIDIEIPEAFSLCFEIETEQMNTFIQFCHSKKLNVIDQNSKSPLVFLPDGSSPEGSLVWVLKPLDDSYHQQIFYPNIMNIYEDSHPLFKGTIIIGAVVRGVSDLHHQRTDLSRLYLHSSFPFIFVYHSEVKKSHFCLIVSTVSSFSKAYIFTCGMEVFSKSNAEKIANSMNVTLGFLTVESFSSTKQFVTTFSRIFDTLPVATSALLIAQSNSDLLVNILNVNERPILWRNLEIFGPLDVSQALALSQYFFKESLNSYISLPTWLQSEIDICRTLNIPLCRYRSHQHLWTNLDIAYARVLRSKNRILPNFNSSFMDPSHLTSFMGDFLSLQSTLEESRKSSLCSKSLLGASLVKGRNSLWNQEESSFVNQSGFYGNVCFQLELGSVFVCSILESAILIPPDLYDLDCLSNSEVNDKSNNISETLFTSPILRRVDKIIKQVSKTEVFIASGGVIPLHTNQGRQAITPLIEFIGSLFKNHAKSVPGSTKLISSLENWLINPKGLVSNLLGTIIQLKQRLLITLILELNRLGFSVLLLGKESYGISTTIPLIISCNKIDESSAIYSLNWAIGEIVKCPGLCWLDLTLLSGWKRLLWMNRFNYCGEKLSETVNFNNNTNLDGKANNEITESIDWVWDLARNLLPEDTAPWAAKAMFLVFDGLSKLFPNDEDDPNLDEQVVMDLFTLVRNFASSFNEKEHSTLTVSLLFAHLIASLLLADIRIASGCGDSISRSLISLAFEESKTDISIKLSYSLEDNDRILSGKKRFILLPIKCELCCSITCFDLSGSFWNCSGCKLHMSRNVIEKAAYDSLQILQWNLSSAATLCSSECQSCGTTSERTLSKWCPKCTAPYSSKPNDVWKNSFKSIEDFKQIILGQQDLFPYLSSFLKENY